MFSYGDVIRSVFQRISLGKKLLEIILQRTQSKNRPAADSNMGESAVFIENRYSGYETELRGIANVNRRETKNLFLCFENLYSGTMSKNFALRLDFCGSSSNYHFGINTGISGIARV